MYQVGSHVRVLVHTANHNVPDECWDLQPEGAADRFAIVKSMNRYEYHINSIFRTIESMPLS